MGILDEAIREIALEKQAAEDDAWQALEDFDMITSRAVDTVKKTVAALRVELQAADWWAGELSEDNQKPAYLSLSFRLRRHANNPDLVTNPDYSYSIKFDALGSATRTMVPSIRCWSRWNFAVWPDKILARIWKRISSFS